MNTAQLSAIITPDEVARIKGQLTDDFKDYFEPMDPMQMLPHPTLSTHVGLSNGDSVRMYFFLDQGLLDADPCELGNQDYADDSRWIFEYYTSATDDDDDDDDDDAYTQEDYDEDRKRIGNLLNTLDKEYDEAVAAGKLEWVGWMRPDFYEDVKQRVEGSWWANYPQDRLSMVFGMVNEFRAKCKLPLVDWEDIY